jgi:hypothetical protein
MNSRILALSPDSDVRRSSAPRKPQKKTHREHGEKPLFRVLRVPFFRGYKEAQIEPQIHLPNRNNPVECNARKQANFGIEAKNSSFQHPQSCLSFLSRMLPAAAFAEPAGIKAMAVSGFPPALECRAQAWSHF